MTTKQGVEFDRIINDPVPGLRSLETPVVSHEQYSYMTLIICMGPYAYFSRLFIRDDVISHDLYNIYHVTLIYSLGGASDRVLA